MIISSPLPGLVFPEITLTELLFGGDLPDRPALVDPGGRVTTFPELRAWTEAIAGRLHAAGIGAGEVVGLFAPNSPEWVASFHGILRANAVVTSANVLYTPGELAHQLVDSGARALVTTAALLPVAEEAAAKAGIDLVVDLDDWDRLPAGRPRSRCGGPRTPRCCPTRPAPRAGPRAWC